MEKWHIQNLDGSTIVILTCLWKVVEKEKELREKGIPYKTDFYVDNKLVGASNRRKEGN